MAELTAEQIAELLKPKRRGRGGRTAQEVFADLANDESFDPFENYEPLPCSSCGVLKSRSGYCLNEECDVDKPIQTYPCSFCGHCSTPNQCVRSIECPTCQAQAGDCCQRSNGNPDSFHEERWQEVRSLYGTYYKHESDSDLELLVKLGLINAESDSDSN